MNTAKDVLLSSTLNDPRGVFLDVLTKVSNVVLTGYKGWVISVTSTTDQRVKDALRALIPQGIFVTEIKEGQPFSSDVIENNHLNVLNQAVAIAKKQGIRKIQYTDGDRIITAANHYPQDLLKMARRASELLGDTRSYINFRRSVEAYFSHHPPLVQTEFEYNRLYSEAFGMPIDIGSTAHGMSLDVVEEILRRSPQMEVVSFPHPKWLLIAKEMGVPPQSEEIQDVLTFEAPDQSQKRAGESYKKVQQDYMATLGLASTVLPEEWDLRFKTEGQYLSLLRNHLEIFRFDGERERKLHGEISQALGSMEGRHKAIDEALKRPPEEIHKMIQERAEHVLSQRLSKPEGN